VAPIRAKLRIDREAPKWRKSNTERDDPNLTTPSNEIDEARRQNDLRESEEPN
jgi:hypothetical protein